MTLARNKSILYISTFLILYASTSFFCKNLLSESVNICICLVAVAAVIATNLPVRVNRNAALVFVMLSIIGVVSSLLASDSTIFLAYPIISMGIALMYVSCVSFDEFRNVYVTIMVFLCAFAVAVYIITLFFPFIIRLMPVMVNKSQSRAYNFLFAIVRDTSFVRVEGIFWEPGAFQTFICLALLMLANGRSRYKRVKILILYTALLFTFSITGYIAGYIALILLLFKSESKSRFKMIKILLTLGAFVIVGVIVLNMLPDTLGGVRFGLDKITEFLSGTSDERVTSASVRFDAIYYPLNLFADNPVIGAGRSGLEGLSENMLHGMFTCTPINYFAMYGIFYGAVAMYCYYKAVSVSSYTFYNAIAFSVFLVTVLSEQYVSYPIINLFLMYGACKVRFRRKRSLMGIKERYGDSL
ncbi:MAG: hypothetical protein IJ457_03085 [Clostridia bacterium]|nr:hypothetical protein [Clostridia bacterium]